MAYVPTNWVNDVPPALNATNLNHLTDELKAQALVSGISHSLPTWINGAPPAISDPATLNEMERVVDLVAASLSLSYTPTVWQAGWTPSRNATRLNHLEAQAQANRVVIDTPPPSGAFWVADFEEGNTSELYSNQQIVVGHIAAVGAPLNISGSYSCRFINGVSDYNTSLNQRTECIVQPKVSTSFFGADVSLEGRTTWMTWKFLLDPNYEEPLDTWGVLTQYWTNGLVNGSPCFALENPRLSPSARARLQVTIRGGGVNAPYGGTSAQSFERVAGVLEDPVSRGVIHHIKVYRLWSSGSGGQTKVWHYLTGQSVPTTPAINDTGPNLATYYPSGVEHKCGIYRSHSGVTRDSYIIIDDISYYASDPGTAW